MLDASRWRHGDRDAEARDAHTQAERDRRRDLLYTAHPPHIRAAILDAIAAGASPAEAARAHGSNGQSIYALARLNPEWGDQLDAATEASCICGGDGWRRERDSRRRCHCPAARAYRTAESRRERAAAARRSAWLSALEA